MNDRRTARTGRRPVAASASRARCRTRRRRCGARSPNPSTSQAWFPTDDHRRASPTGATLRFEFRDGEGPSFDGTMITCRSAARAGVLLGRRICCASSSNPTATGTVLTLTDTFDELGKAARDARRLARTASTASSYALDGTRPRSGDDRLEGAQRRVHRAVRTRRRRRSARPRDTPRPASRRGPSRTGPDRSARSAPRSRTTRPSRRRRGSR